MSELIQIPALGVAFAVANGTVAFSDPEIEVVVTRPVESAEDVDALIAAVLGKPYGRGHPALELHRVGGSCLSLATDGSRALVGLTDAEGRSFDSVGSLGTGGPVLVFDYMGFWSEAPSDMLVPLPDVLEAARQFVLTGNPQTGRVQFTDGWPTTARHQAVGCRGSHRVGVSERRISVRPDRGMTVKV